MIFNNNLLYPEPETRTISFAYAPLVLRQKSKSLFLSCKYIISCELFSRLMKYDIERQQKDLFNENCYL